MRPARCHRASSVVGGDGEARGEGGPGRGEGQVLLLRWTAQTGRGKLTVGKG